MTTQFTIDFQPQGRFAGDPGYAFYGALCARFDEDFAARLHAPDAALINQYAVPGFEQRPGKWRIFCHTDEAAAKVRAALQSPAFSVRGTPVTLLAVAEQALAEGAELERQAEARFGASRIYRLNFLTATTFKQAGAHVLFPSVKLIYQSMLARRAETTGAQLDDADALAALIDGTHISAYRLESSYYPLKDGNVAGFRGQLTLTLRLAEPLRLFARSLFCFAERTGVGAKTALGMGGLTVDSPAFRASRA